ncbi:RNA polymerase II-associated protein 3-like isoform X2 [Macrobrachium rosenbergii]|uniref:RNA polymerase II-associated protein 3-like isoform X2 n=1 Tax=Macrobrachium rosenbergii TaxID=79674 RepID=UPI0034D56D6C
MSENLAPSIRLQKEIKENSLEVQDFIADLRKWEKDVKEKEECREGQGRNEDFPPVRCRKPDGSTRNIVTDNRKRKEEREPDMKKKERISSYDYAAWDRFDVDKALESSSSDDDKELSSETSESQTTETNSQSSYKTPSLSKKERAVKLKDEGNKHYSDSRLEDAVAKYTQGMALDPTNPILPANRAMAYIKLEKYEAAEVDCSRCLKLDPSYIKAYLRRGTSRLKLGKIQRATEDFRKVLELEPWNKDAKKELENIEKQKDVSLNKEKSDQEKKSPQSGKKLIAETSANTTSQRVEKGSRETMASSEPPETKQKFGKKLRITEVGYSSDAPSISLSEGSGAVMPIVKPPHQRSQKPLQKIRVVDVPSPESLPKELPSCSVPKESRVEDISNSVTSKVRAVENSVNSREQDVIAAKNAQNKLETQAVVPSSVPPVPRTSYQFSQDWQRISRHQSHAVEYVKAIQPSFFHNIDLEMEVFVDFVSALRWNEFGPEDVVLYLSALARSDGFGVNLMFLDDKQKKVFHEVVDKCKCQGKLHSELISKLEANSL